MNTALKVLNSENFEAAIREWKLALGLDRVILDGDALAKADRCTFEAKSSYRVILKPKTAIQVSEVAKIASRYSISIYTISRGYNWGYGSSIPAEETFVLNDLSDMNQISEFNTELGYVRVQPGVSISQISKFLADGDYPWIISPGGAPSDSSLIGNVMERGLAGGRSGDRINWVTDFQIVTGKGEIIETGFSRFKNCKSKSLYKWGLGPSLDGLFSQSNLGIVTELTYWLAPQPNKNLQTAMFNMKSDDQLEQFIENVRPLVLQGTVGTPFPLWNSHKILATNQQYPWHLTTSVPLSLKLTDRLIKETQPLPVNEWNGTLPIYSTSIMEGLGKAFSVRRAIGSKVSSLFIMGRWSAFWARAVSGLFKALTGLNSAHAANVGYFRSNLRGFAGSNTGANTIFQMYWRKKKVDAAGVKDPHQDKCGLIMVTAVIPCLGRDLVNFIRIARSIYQKHQYEPMLTVGINDSRSITIYAGIKFDREIQGEDARAEKCWSELSKELRSEGYLPARQTVNQPHLDSDNSEYDQVLTRLRLALDPNNVLSPNRYHRSR